MKLISWDVKGAGRKSFYSQVKLLMSKYVGGAGRKGVIIFIETIVNSNRACKIIIER